MEWHFCYGDGNCWATWFWSSSTAAWAQALLTVGVILWTVVSTRRANELDKEKTREIFEHEAELQRSQAKESEKLAFSLFERERDLNRERDDVLYFQKKRREETRLFFNLLKAKFISDRIVLKIEVLDAVFEKYGVVTGDAISDAILELSSDCGLLRESLLLDMPSRTDMETISMQIVCANGFLGVLRVLQQDPGAAKREYFTQALEESKKQDQMLLKSENYWRVHLEGK